MADETKPRGRRADYAALTKEAIVDAARTLFTTQGFFATTVEEIAALARVAPATVYSAGGGKLALLSTLMDRWQASPDIRSDYHHRVMEAHDGEGDTVLRATAAGCRRTREEWGDVERVFLSTAPHEERVAEILDAATVLYRSALELAAQRLADVGALRSGLRVPAATDTLWFYFGYTAWFTLTDDNGWSLKKAERWLLDQARAALFQPG